MASASQRFATCRRAASSTSSIRGTPGNALADLLLGLPVLTGGAHLDNPQKLQTTNWNLFVHDDWRVRPSVTVSAGLRYDYIGPPVDEDDRANLYDQATGQLVPVGTGTMPRGGYEPDRNNLAPRVGLAWTLDRSARTVLRGGYGIYYNQGALATSEGLYFNPPYFNLGVYFPVPGLPPLTLADPFPSSFPVFIPPSATAYQRDLQTPWLEHYNVNVQRQYGTSRAIEFAYVGSRGHDLISARDGNQAAASAAPLNLRPNPLFADITLIESRASSKYNALPDQVSAARRAGPVDAAGLYAGQVQRRCLRLLHQRGRPELPAEQPRSRRRVRAVQLRRAAPLLGQLRLRAAARRQRVAARHRGPGHRLDPERAAVHRRAAAGHRQQQHRPLEPRIRLQRSSEPHRAIRRSTARRPSTGSTPRPSRCRRSAPFGNAGRNSLTGPDYKNVNLAVIKYLPVGSDGAAAAAGRSLQPAEPRSTSTCLTPISDRPPSARSCQPAARGGSSSG